MDKTKSVTGDAHIPSDTESFEENATMFRMRKPTSITEQVRAQKEELDIQFRILTNKLSSFAQFYIQNDQEVEAETGQKFKLGPVTLLVECFINIQIALAQQEVLSETLGGIAMGGKLPPDIARLARVQLKLAERIDEWERAYGIRVEETRVSIPGRREGDDGTQGSNNRRGKR